MKFDREPTKVDITTVNRSKSYMNLDAILRKEKSYSCFDIFIISITTITLRGIPRYLDVFFFNRPGTILLLFELQEEYFRYNRLGFVYSTNGRLAGGAGGLRPTICF